MPDSPDYDKYRPNSVRFSLQDMGELAARMNSPVTFDRRGEVLFMDNFAQGVEKYVTGGTGGTGDFVLTADNPLVGGFAGKLITNNVTDANQYFRREFSSSDLGRAGFETSLNIAANLSNIQIRMYQYDGLVQRQFRIKIDNENNLLQYLDSDGNFQTLDTIAWFNNSAGLYRYIKLVVDFETGQYVRLLIDRFEYDLSDIQGQTSVISEQYAYLVQVVLTTRSNTSITINVGHVIITGNEP